MLCRFYDPKGMELWAGELAAVPVQKDSVIIRGIHYTVIQRILDFNAAPPVWRIEVEHTV